MEPTNPEPGTRLPDPGAAVTAPPAPGSLADAGDAEAARAAARGVALSPDPPILVV